MLSEPDVWSVRGLDAWNRLAKVTDLNPHQLDIEAATNLIGMTPDELIRQEAVPFETWKRIRDEIAE